jgi:exodeoxyribonuclease VII large subunit
MAYTVSDINNLVKKALQKDFKNQIIVEGEISNLKVSGQHTYLNLKDASSSISVIFWNTKLTNKHGDNVSVSGKIDYYTKNGYTNIIGNAIKNIGIGDLHIEYEKLKNNYEKKGYFNNRKSLPGSVKKIGIITSDKGAALQDFLYVLNKNKFMGEVLIYDCIVQGPKCPISIVKGINHFNNSNVELIIITRGGGSFEDLMGFSHPTVIEAIYNSDKYIISAVGHEVDNMLSDYVANYRAPTPSIAAEVVCSININDDKKIIYFEQVLTNIKNTIVHSLYKYKHNIQQIKKNITDPTIQYDKYLDTITYKALSHVKNILSTYKAQLNKFKQNNNDMNILLQDGYNIITYKGRIVKNISEVFNKSVVLVDSSGSYNIIIKQKIEKKRQ